MLSTRVGAPSGLRWGIFSLVAVMSVLALSSETSDARARRKHVPSSEASSSEEPRYSDIVVDGNSGAILHASNPDALRHPASLTKVMTLYLLFEQLDAGKLKLDSSLEVSEHAAIQSPTKLGLRDGQSIKVEDAIKGIVTRSANDAAVVVAESIGGDEESFAKLMTHKAQSLGMAHTVYRNASGLPNDDQVTTARDQALLGRAIQERFPRYYKFFSTRSFEFRGETIGNHNKLLGSVDGVDGIKTGYISASGFNIVTSVHRDNRYLLAVVFGGSSAGSRDERMRELIHDHIAEAAVQHTAAPLVAQTGSQAGSEARFETKLGATFPPPAYALASATGTSFRLPSPKPDPKTQAKPEAKAASQPEAKSASQTYEVASAATVPVTLTSKSDPGATTTIQVPRWATTNSAPAPHVAAPAIGSEDPIHPVAVKTVMVKPGSTVQTAALAPPQLPDSAPPATAPAPVKAAAVSFPPPGTRPGAIAGLPSHITTGSVTEAVPAPAAEPAPPAAAPQAAVRTGWMIQVGAFPAEGEAKQRLSAVQSKASHFLASADAFTESVSKGESVIYRARFAGLGKEQAEAACNYLKHNDVDCMTIKN
jgi:D-alanyl-D-alanine carboxypeptidase